MPAELDHLFVCVDAGAPEAATLTALGLVEGTPNEHPGQGTACRRFFFHNVYLELLWVSEPTRAQAEPVRRTGLWARWQGRKHGACPFGLCFRPAMDSTDGPPFGGWEYRALYLPPGMSFLIGHNSHMLTEPGLFYLEFARGRRPDRAPAEKRQPLEHRAGVRELTRLALISPSMEGRSPELDAVVRAGLVHLRRGDGYAADLGFDGEATGKKTDLRSGGLPLVLRW